MEVSQEYKEIPAQLGVLSDDTTSLMINSIEDSYIGLHGIKITYTGIDLMLGQTFEESFTLTVLQPVNEEETESVNEEETEPVND